jgi:demethylmenaquinone methyltransferase/2-methoxy-6-polyprenyl-1,4-benzoquinol methylase
MDHYKLLAGVYDPLLHVALRKIRKRVVDLAERLQPGQIIDICCGTGNQLKYLKKHGFQNITGVDISDAMLKQAGKGKLKIQCGNEDATDMSFDSDSFDMGIISLALHEKPYELAQQILNESQRVIRPGGHLIVVDYVFDQHTSPFIRLPVHIAEKIAGRDHYKHFREYLEYGGMDKLMNYRRFDEEYRFHRGATMLRIYRIGKDQYA